MPPTSSQTADHPSPTNSCVSIIRKIKAEDSQEIKNEGSATGAETYSITANLDKSAQISIKFERPANSPGFKFGEGPGAGFSTFGKEKEDGKRDGLVVQ